MTIIIFLCNDVKANNATSRTLPDGDEAERLAMCASRPGPLCPSRGINGKALIDWRFICQLF